MPVHVVVGGQYGSEGKGKVALHFARQFGIKAAVKVSGTNAGHTVYDAQGNKHIFRVLPSACVLPGVYAVISAGAYFQPRLLLEECERVNFPMDHLLINPMAGVITDEIQAEEKATDLRERIGTTNSGTGLATYHRVALDGKFVAARDIPELQHFIYNTTAIMRNWLNDGADIMIEGAQGFGLSLYHTPVFPYCTSRDTTASAFVADAGLSPLDVQNIIMVLRSYEIRVGGNSGPMYKEITWDEVSRRAGKKCFEMTSVSKTVRRVGEFDSLLVHRAYQVNKPNIVVMNFMDYIKEDAGVVENMMGPRRLEFIKWVERETKCKITHVGFDGDDVRTVEEATM